MKCTHKNTEIGPQNWRIIKFCKLLSKNLSWTSKIRDQFSLLFEYNMTKQNKSNFNWIVQGTEWIPALPEYMYNQSGLPDPRYYPAK